MSLDFVNQQNSHKVSANVYAKKYAAEHPVCKNTVINTLNRYTNTLPRPVAPCKLRQFKIIMRYNYCDYMMAKGFDYFVKFNWFDEFNLYARGCSRQARNHRLMKKSAMFSTDLVVQTEKYIFLYIFIYF